MKPIDTYDIDYPMIRKQDVCPICEKHKDCQLIACWDCWRKYDMRNGLNHTTHRLMQTVERRELALDLIGRLGMVLGWWGC